ncbi:MFS transporter [Streptomyces sp. MBT59]|uniref:MFS transporter n=1 Tax=Streptomyces sp. MBT59 TaxID=1488390 RepID=UPI00191344D5|nr:MFS transporter [Streptomyces sp. MBT59]MBK6031009.1 MFS transporter [Streptomyces sp. MBT59]
MLADLLPASRNGRIIAAGSAVEAVAVGMFLAAATLYFVGIVGIPAVAVGGALTVANVIGLLSPAPTGALAGRIGSLPVYVGLTLLRAVGFVAYAFVDGYAGYFVVTCLITAATRAAMPLLQVIVGELEPADRRTRTMASLRAVSNIGMTAGFLLAAVVQASGSRPVFMALFGFNGLAFVAVALLIGRAARSAAARPASARAGATPEARADAGRADGPPRVAAAVPVRVRHGHERAADRGPVPDDGVRAEGGDGGLAGHRRAVHGGDGGVLAGGEAVRQEAAHGGAVTDALTRRNEEPPRGTPGPHPLTTDR